MRKQQNNSNENRSAAQGQQFPRNKLKLTTKELEEEITSKIKINKFGQKRKRKTSQNRTKDLCEWGIECMSVRVVRDHSAVLQLRGNNIEHICV